MKKLFMVLPLALILCLVVGCQDKEAMAELEEFKAQAAVEEQNKVLIRNLYEQWHSRNIDALTEMHAPNAKYHHPSAGATPIPIEKALEAMQMYWQAFPDLTLTVEDIIAEGDKVVVRFIGRGTHQGDLGGIPAKGLKTEASGMEIYHFKDGKIVEVWEISDALGLMQQLGMELKPKEGGEID
ncbi:MAG: ester cyclase [Candidatus Aminicenantaceae bacterium]